ncbi:hypothetical protein BVG16_27340 [Paenibacillus selenitireducens]|uniref:Phospholipase C/D domain-containing protein n=1 Tax=Paenibacillus selenitireducens TaxID=1324314 RepID=A0A1T2X1T7_9BACL|nr:hypothetical protein [Paenibacillus selenitireducens]OPA73797.1 hypothetical protein BVG16_27340 [Paenibacillus selenitireducens]
MPWPMVHFATAIHTSITDPSPSFLLGSIAPDAIHMRDNITRKDKGMTHLVYEDKLPNIEKLTKHCLDYLHQNPDPDWKAYVWGYFAHIYTDGRWTDTVYADFEKDYSGDMKDLRSTYNQEAGQVEFHIMRSGQWSENVFTKLKSARAFSIDPFVTETEVSKYRDSKLHWLQDEKNEPKIEPIYFHEKVVNDFIINTSNELKEIFKVWGKE